MKKLILASHSPRRKQLLKDAGIEFESMSIEVKEDYPINLDLEKVAPFLAKKKAMTAWNALSDVEKQYSVVLSCDTIVRLGNKILGKPKTAEEATQMLVGLSGNVHEVITAAIMIHEGGLIEITDITKVHFKELNSDQIKHYVNNYNPFDKAGAYGIQDWIGLIGIKQIEGDFYAVMGLPINQIMDACLKLKIKGMKL